MSTAPLAETGLSEAGPITRLALDPATLEQDLGRLVLTLVELVRRLMEGQALRRMEAGTLSAEETERLGLGLMQLRGAVETLCGRLGLRPEELNLDLGPLGRLL
ncbi:gas vesicle protein K [Falsiroseomonas selenitidurans]|uniref:Gas vesicle protein K n=1 Tax=Falsiroseomonas selenitidurans TaxID=2716335 RepID=A0ABX1EC13_9PROT|nr:gas vesicle protein K [Falsiroseomonas selenitidurans]NKC34541.1 gas vesicle protein K [Falsiroseomonas selenitidurans]